MFHNIYKPMPQFLRDYNADIKQSQYIKITAII